MVLARCGWRNSVLVSRLALWVIDSRLRHIRVAVGDGLGRRLRDAEVAAEIIPR